MEKEKGHGDTSRGPPCPYKSSLVCVYAKKRRLFFEAAVSLEHDDRLLDDGFFSFAVVRQIVSILEILCIRLFRLIHFPFRKKYRRKVYCLYPHFDLW